MQVLTRLRANLFDREGAVSAFLPVLPYLPVSADGSDGSNYDHRDGKRHGRGHLYSSGYGGSSDLAAGDGFGSYGSSQVLVYNHEFLRIFRVDESYSACSLISYPVFVILFQISIAWWQRCLWGLWKLFFGAHWYFWVTNLPT